VKRHTLHQNIANKISAHKIPSGGDFLPAIIETVPPSHVAVQSDPKRLLIVEGMQGSHEFSRLVEDTEGYHPFAGHGKSDFLGSSLCGNE
jgi:hypothetical protein